MFNARFGHQAWGFLSSCASACVSVHVKIDKPEKDVLHTQMHKKSENTIPDGQTGYWISNIIFLMHFDAYFTRFSAQQQLLSGPEVPKTTISNGVFELSAKSAFSHVFYRIKQALPKFVGQKTPFRMGETGYREHRNPWKSQHRKSLVFYVLLKPRNKNRILTRKIRIKISTKGGKKKCVYKKNPFEMGQNPFYTYFTRIWKKIPFEMV